MIAHNARLLAREAMPGRIPNAPTSREYESSRVPRDKSGTGFNLKGVIEVLIEEGFDPIAEMVAILKEPEKLDRDTRLKFSNELAKYVHAQRKQVDVSAKVELTDEQADRRLAQLLKQAESITGEDMA